MTVVQVGFVPMSLRALNDSALRTYDLRLPTSILPIVLKRVTLILLLVVVGWLAWEWIRFPDVAALVDQPPKTTAFMEQRKEKLRDEGKSDELEWRWVPYGRISPSL